MMQSKVKHCHIESMRIVLDDKQIKTCKLVGGTKFSEKLILRRAEDNEADPPIVCRRKKTCSYISDVVSSVH
jgi:hypothetical protein